MQSYHLKSGITEVCKPRDPSLRLIALQGFSCFQKAFEVAMDWEGCELPETQAAFVNFAQPEEVLGKPEILSKHTFESSLVKNLCSFKVKHYEFRRLHLTLNPASIIDISNSFFR